MPTTFMSGRDFNQDVGRAKRAADTGPVVVTDRGNPAYVLLTHDAYCRLTGESGQSIVDMLRDSAPGADFDWEPPKLSDMGLQPAEFG